MVLVKDLALALALASAASAYGFGNEEQSGLAPRGAALEQMLDKFMKRDVEDDFAALSARDIEELIARDPEVAELIQNIGENFVKRDGSEITTRDLQLVARDGGSAGFGQGLWSSVKSLFGRDVDADALIARDLDILRDNFVRRDGGEITGDDLDLFVREAPKSNAGAPQNPLSDLNKKSKAEEKKLGASEKKIDKEMKKFEDKMEGKDKKGKDGESKKGKDSITDAKHSSKDSKHSKDVKDTKDSKHGKDSKLSKTHSKDHKKSEKHSKHKDHKSKKTSKKSKAKTKAKAKKMKAKQKKLKQKQKKQKAKVEKKKAKADKLQKEVETAEKKLEKMNERLEKMEKKEAAFEKKHEHDSEKSSKKDKRDELWARDAEAEAWADPEAWAEPEAYFDEDDLELIARELVDLERREPGLVSSIVKGGEKLLGKGGKSGASAAEHGAAKSLPKAATSGPGGLPQNMPSPGPSKMQKAGDLMNGASNVAMTGMMAQGMYGQQKRDLGFDDEFDFDLFARDAGPFFYADMDDEFELFAREAEAEAEADAEAETDFEFEEELWAREAEPEAYAENFAGWSFDGLEELYE